MSDIEDILEKRQDVRLTCSSPVQVALPKEAVPVVGELCDMSASGLRMRLNRALRPGEEYPIYVAPGQGQDGMFVAASPVWIKATTDGYGFEIGCRFTDGTRMPNRYKQERRAIRLCGTFDTQLIGKGKVRIHAVTRDISLSGAGIVSPVEVQPGTRLQAHIDLVPHGMLKAPIEIVHCKPLQGHMAGYQLGVAFWPMAPREARRLSTVLHRLKEG